MDVGFQTLGTPQTVVVFFWPFLGANEKLLLKIVGRGQPSISLQVGHLAWQVEQITLHPWRTPGA